MRFRKMLHSSAGLVCLLVALAGQAVAADILKIETETSLEVSAERVRVNVTFANRGTAPAFNLQAHLIALGQTDASRVVAQLDPGRSEKALFEREIKGIGKGRYPMTVRVDFHDANQYPFSALSGMTFHIGEAVNPELAALGRDTTLGRSGAIQFDLKNLGPPLKGITATLALPKEFSSPQPMQTFDMDQRSDRRVAFEVRNFSALAGASYPVFCYFEYDAAGVHHTALSRCMLTVAPDESLFRRYRWAWVTLAGILACILMVVLIRERQTHRRLPNS